MAWDVNFKSFFFSFFFLSFSRLKIQAHQSINASTELSPCYKFTLKGNRTPCMNTSSAMTPWKPWYDICHWRGDRPEDITELYRWLWTGWNTVCWLYDLCTAVSRAFQIQSHIEMTRKKNHLDPNLLKERKWKIKDRHMAWCCCSVYLQKLQDLSFPSFIVQTGTSAGGWSQTGWPPNPK